MSSKLSIVKIIFGVVAVLAQAMLAPYIAIGFAQPNFIMVAVLSVAVASPARGASIFAFVLGLIYDLMGGGPLGTMALTLVVMSALVQFAIRQVGNDTHFMAFMLLFIAILLAQLLYGLLLLGFGYEATLGEVLIYRVLPCTLYTCVLGFIFYPLAVRFGAEKSTVDAIPEAKVGVGSL